MRTLGPSRLIDALADWGAHEASGRLRGQVQPPPAGDVAVAADLALRYRAPFIAHILSHHLADAIRADLEPQDANHLVLADGRSLEQWIANATADALAHFERLRDAAGSPQGPVVAAVFQPGVALPQKKCY